MAARGIETKKRFRAVLEKEHGLGWTIARVPFDPAKAWPKMIRRRVRGQVNGTVLRTSLFADANGYFLLVNRETQKKAQVSLGDSVEITLEPDLEPRPAELPDVLAALLDGEAGLRKWYDTLSESRRREIGKWVLGVKRGGADASRATNGRAVTGDDGGRGGTSADCGARITQQTECEDGMGTNDANAAQIGADGGVLLPDAGGA